MPLAGLKGEEMLSYHKSEKGQAIVMIALAIFALFALVALAMDGGQAFSDRRKAQNAVDAAAYAAALTYVKELGNPNTKALERLDSNDYTEANTEERTVQILTSSKCPPGGTGIEFTITLKTIVNTWFAGIIGISQLNNIVSSTSRACSTGSNEQQTTNASVMSCATKDCAGAPDKDIFINGSPLLNLYGGSLFNNSIYPDCIFIKNGDTNLYQNSDGTCATISSVSPEEGSTVEKIIYHEPCTSDEDLLWDQVPRDCPADVPVSCLPNHPDPVGDTAYPGTYGNFPPNHVTKLEPGLYCITGDFKLNGTGLTVTGTKAANRGVTFFMETGSITWTGNESRYLYATEILPSPAQPGSGEAIPGLLIFAPLSNKSTFRLAGEGYTELQGTVLASGAHCVYSGNSELGSEEEPQYVQFICDTWELIGNDDLSIEYDSKYFYDPVDLDTIMLVK